MQRGLVVAGLLLSGAAGLIHQVSWILAASLALGSTQLAVSTVVAVFFLGLALGSELFGRRALGLARPLRGLAHLELGVAALAACVLPGLALADRAFGHVYRLAGEAGPAPGVARALLLVAVLLPPTVLMGGTLPLVCRAWVARAAELEPRVGGAYAANTLGAFAGCLLAGLVLLPRVGLRPAIAAGVAASLVSAACFAAAARGEPRLAPAPRVPGARPAAARPALVALFFAAGLVALGSEVLWTRFLALVVRHSVETYTLALSVVLLGIVLGSAAVARWPVPARSRAAAFGALQVAYGVSLFVALHLPPERWRALEGRLAPLALLLLPPAVLSGASFPLAAGIGVTDPGRAARGVGRLLAANTTGGVSGSLLVGFLLLPGLGMDATLSILCAVALASGTLAWLRLGPPRGAGRAAALLAGAALVFALLHLGPRTRLPEDWLAHGEERLIDHREGRTATLAVVRDEVEQRLESDGWWQGSDRWTHQAMAAHVPMLLHPGARRVLVVGVGTGQTPARFLLHGVERLDCVDVEPAVFDLVRAHFDARWLADPRVRALQGDGRAHLLHGADRFDVISLELGQAFRPGVAAFYTLEFYRRARERLAPGGMLVQFVPLPFLEPALLRSLVASFAAVFPRSLLWYNTSELLLIGVDGAAPLGAQLAARLAEPAIRADLDHRLWGGPGNELARLPVFLAGLLAGPAGVVALAGGAAPLRDGSLALDLAAGRVPERATREIELVPLLRASLEPAERVLDLSAGAAPPEQVARIREGNLGEIEANAWVRSVAFLDPVSEDAEIRARLERALRANPEHGPAHRGLGDRALRAGRADEAIGHLREALRIAADDVGARRALGVALLAAGRAGEAAHHLRRALAQAPEHAASWNALGVALARQGHAAPAVRAFEEALRLAPADPEPRRNLSQARGFLGRRDSPGFPSESP